MKKYLEELRLYIFGELVLLIFKISKNFRLIKFEKVERNGIIDYHFIVRIHSTKQPDSGLVDSVLEYLNDLVIKN